MAGKDRSAAILAANSSAASLAAPLEECQMAAGATIWMIEDHRFCIHRSPEGVLNQWKN
jgi:hypothetical protein